MLPRVLLHVIPAPRPVDHPLEHPVDRVERERGLQAMRHPIAFVNDVGHRDAPQRPHVVWLPPRGGVEGRLIEVEESTIVGAVDHAGLEPHAVGVGVVESLRHGTGCLTGDRSLGAFPRATPDALDAHPKCDEHLADCGAVQVLRAQDAPALRADAARVDGKGDAALVALSPEDRLLEDRHGAGGGGPRGNLRSVLPRHDVSLTNRSALQDLTEGATSPRGEHPGAQPVEGLVHSLARLGLTPDGDPALADAQDAAARLLERASAQQEIGPAPGGVEGAAQRRHVALPHLLLDHGHLACSPAIRIVEKPQVIERGLAHAIHRAQPGPLDPDALERPVRGDGRGWR